MTKITTSEQRRNPVGERHGRLVVVGREGQDRWKAPLWRFHCDCGKDDYVARLDQVRRGLILSCGCLRAEKAAKRCAKRVIHGHGKAGKQTTEYISWRGMNNRCYTLSNGSYLRYGGRGITVCDRWRGQDGFAHFLTDMGTKPSRRHSIGRMDNDGNYEPDNCRWESASRQGRNRSTNRYVTYLGKEMTIAEACETAGIKRNVVAARMRLGWTPERAVTTPVKYYQPRL